MATSPRTVAAGCAILALSCSEQRPAPVATESKAQPGVAALLVGPDELGSDSEKADGLRAQLGHDPYTYFRFINRRWSKAVCTSLLEAELGFVVTSLHGDAHLSQYAVTTDQRGLDDFDDSARGPAALDIVRFLASVELVLEERGWEAHRPEAFDAFAEAYRRSIADPAYLPPEPAYASRLRSQLMSQAEFLEWAESLMEPFDEHARREHAEAARRFAATMLESRPELPPTYFDLKRSGWLHIGVGSALTRKQLARVEGPTLAPEDDIVLEAKQLSDLSGIDCIQVDDATDAMRVIDGSRRVGRIQHDIMAVVPPPPGGDPAGRDWWVRSWAPSYTEIDLDDLKSAAELVEIARDVGAQLGRGHRAEAREAPTLEQERLQRYEVWARREVSTQVRSLLQAWELFRRGAA